MADEIACDVIFGSDALKPLVILKFTEVSPSSFFSISIV